MSGPPTRERSRWERWTDERNAAFARDWNDGLDLDALREKYGIRRVGYHATALRAKGYALTKRTPGPKRKAVAAQ